MFVTRYKKGSSGKVKNLKLCPATEKFLNNLFMEIKSEEITL